MSASFLFSIRLQPLNPHRLRLQNGRASNARWSIARTAETRAGKFLQRVRSAARMDNQPADAPDPAAGRESDKVFPARPKGQALSAAIRACRDCPDARKARWSPLARKSCRRT